MKSQSSLFRVKFLVPLFLLSLTSLTLHAQNVLSGVVRDKNTNETLIGASVSIKGKSIGVITDVDGKWELKFKEDFPVTIQVNYLGYRLIEFTATKSGESFSLRMEADERTISEVKVVGERVAQKLKESPVTIERMGIQEIKQTASVGFYEGLAGLKGVDMTSASLGFKIINTRGFNSTSPVRTLQLIDGMDNQAPGLNFSLGNFVGASEIDVEKVDIIVGANSATYGPNAFNGVIDITTKDPFKYEGLTVSHKVGDRSLMESSVRFANVSSEIDLKDRTGLSLNFAEFNNKVLKDRFAYKVNVSYLKANDWQATNYNPTTSSKNQQINNEAGYDGVNIYGESEFPNITKVYAPIDLLERGVTPDEIQAGSKYYEYKDVEGENVPFINVYRTGYKEADLTNYNTNSLKLQGGLYYKIPKIGTLSYNYNYGNGTTVYQGDNRYSIKEIIFRQQKLELRNDNFYVKAYQTTEDAGKSYDLVFTAYKMLKSSKSYERWYADYSTGIEQASELNIKGLDNKLAYARSFADNYFDPALGTRPRLSPGTPEFDQEFNRITSNPSFQEGGTKFQDRSSLKHIEGQYNFKPILFSKYLPEIFKVGGNYRKFDPNSFGTIFSDTMNVKGDESAGFKEINTYEYGTYVSTEKNVYKENIKLIGSLRYDDHSNFKPYFSPALSAVITVKQTNNIRLTYTTANRNPTLQDQFLLYDIGVASLKGNLTGFSLILPSDYFGDNGYQAKSGSNPALLDSLRKRIGPVRPEKVRSFEVGYKGILLRNVYVDASYYYSQYTDFLGYIVGFVIRDDKMVSGRPSVETRPTRISANSNSQVITQGTSIGLNYYFPRYFSIGANYTYSELLKKDADDPLIPFFNTPKHKGNLTFGGRDIKSFGFNIAYKYVEGFDYFGSPQFTGPVPSYNLLDAQINYTFKEQFTVVKLGASNLLNNQHIEAYGAPLIGRLFYLSVVFDLNTTKNQ